MNLTKKLAASALVLAAAGSAQALTCGGATGTRTVTVNPAAACTASGLTNLGDGAAAGVVGGTMIDRDAANSNGGSLSITGVGAASGGWSLSSSLWSSYSTLYLYFHFGNGNPTDPAFNPDWFIVQLTSGATAGTWSVNPSQLTLSNIGVIGISSSSSSGGTSGNVPEPTSTAMVCLGLALLGAGFARRRKQS
jgi:hypothetical protein